MGLLTIPPEIWDAIDSHLDDEDRRHLCKCCHSFMNMLQATAYRHVRFDDSAETSHGVLALAFGPRAKFVRKIQYSPLSPNPIGGWEREEWNAHEEHITLSDETRKVLESLHLFVGLEKFRLILDPWDWDLNNWPDIPYSLMRDEFNEYHLARDEEPWRILLEESLLALTKSAGAFSKLEIQGLPPIPTDQPYMALETNGWQTLLQGLTSLEITLSQISETDTGSLTMAHQDFLGNFPRIFFGHLPNVERLRLAGVRGGFVGLREDETPIEWEPLSMPHLKIFEFEYSYLNKSLVSFLGKHLGTLERVYLKHCLGRSKSNWQDLFQTVLERDPSHLVELRIVAFPVAKRTFYTDDQEWEKAAEEMFRSLKEAEERAEGGVLVTWDSSVTADNEENRSDNDPDQPMSDPAPSRETHLQNDTSEVHIDDESDHVSSQGDEGDTDENAYDGDASEDSECYTTRNKRPYVERPKPWDEVVVDERRRRFVVGRTCSMYGDILSVEWYDPENDWELDESDVVESWEKVDKLMQRNMAKVGLVH